MITFLETYLKSLSSDTITEAFFWILTIIFAVGLLIFLKIRNKPKKQGFLQNTMDYSPVLLTSVGILGTFTGIVAGLLNFDINNIDSSISTLLGGMKTAFLSSVVGVSLSIILKLILGIGGNAKDAQNKMDIEPIINNFYEQTKILKEQNDNIISLSNTIETMSKSIGSDSENSLLGQVQRLRNNLSDNNQDLKNILSPISQHSQEIAEISVENKKEFSSFQEKLRKQLDDFAEMMSKSATQAVIEALKQVIQDFNQNLTEQFGDNFKQLNNAVLELVQWQENYKNQLNEMITLYNVGVQSLNITEQAVGNIEKSASTIPETMNNLSEVIAVNQHQINNLAEHLSSFSVMRDKAVEAIPEVQKQIESMLLNMNVAHNQLTSAIVQSTEKLTDEIDKNTQSLGKSIQSSMKEFVDSTSQTYQYIKDNNQSISDHNKSLNDQLTQVSQHIIDNANKWQSEFDKTVQQIQDQFKQSSNMLMEEHIKHSRNLMENLSKQAENALKDTGESVNKQLELIDKSMSIEVNRVMEQMGSALTTISLQFTNDYKTLVDEMKKITSYRS